MDSKHHKPSKQDLLNELESIRHSLSEEEQQQLADGNIDPDDIPVLMDAVADANAMADEELAALDSAADSPDDEDHEALLRKAYRSTLEDAEDLLNDPDATIEQGDTGHSHDSPEPYFSEPEEPDQPQSEATAIDDGNPATRIEAQKREHQQNHPEVAEESEEQIATEDDDELDLGAFAEPAPEPESRVLPGQQSLFGDSETKTHKGPGGKRPGRDKKPDAKSKPAAKPEPILKATGENPFLPKHIRDRLTSNRQQLMNDMAGAELHPTRTHHEPKADAMTRAENEAQDRQAHLEADNAVAHSQEQSRNELVDELVAKYLPEIESELRRRLEAALADKK